MGLEAPLSSDKRTPTASGQHAPGSSTASVAAPQTPSTKSPAQPLTPEELAAKRTRIWIIVASVALILLLVGFVVFMAAKPEAAVVIRDIAIVLVAIETFIIGLAIIVLAFQLQVLTQVLRDEIQPLLRSVNDTVSTVRGTTQFMSHNLVNPIMKWSGFFAGVRRVIDDLTGVARASRPKQTSPNNLNQEE